MFRAIEDLRAFADVNQDAARGFARPIRTVDEFAEIRERNSSGLLPGAVCLLIRVGRQRQDVRR